ERLLRSEAGYLPAGETLVALLELYGRVRRGTPVPYDETDPLCSLLRLSGIVRVAEARAARMVVRNRIYARVFDAGWVAARMPGAELRRQRAAYRRGLLRATGAAALLLGVVASVAAVAIQQAQRTEQFLYAADMNVVQQALEEGDLDRARRILEEHHRPRQF